MKYSFENLKSLIKNQPKRKILALMLLPLVIYGLYYVLSNRNSAGINSYAIDPLLVTYNGDSPPDPMFVVTDMLPGDEVEKVFNVKNDSPGTESVVMDAIKKEELKSFAGILDIEIVQLPSTLIFSGKLQQFFDLPPITLGEFASGQDKSFRIKIKFPDSAGNEYQGAKVVFDITWTTAGPGIELPPECAHLAGIITSVIEGTQGNDNIHGTGAGDLILAKGGRDIVRAGNGDDCIVGGDGNDTRLDGSNGKDVIIGGPGDDRIDGSDDEDILYGNDGNDNIDGSGDNDTIYAGNGDDEVDGGQANDTIYLGNGDDEAEAGSGHDTVYGEAGDDKIDGESGNDNIHGGLDNDNLRGGSGNDQIFGDEGNDTLKGSSGNDSLDGGADTDDLNGNAGTDSCVNGEALNSCEI